MNNQSELYLRAREAMAHAYAPYSGYRVGAALLAADGTVYTGANIENSSYGVTVCAERNALAKAIYDGHREFTAIAIAASGESPAWPCGICRQALFEFGDDIRVITGPDTDHLKSLTISELLPQGFRL
ncbi:MAG: cytidine deaminase [Clostridiales Family XIII bacterium]|jgi:cytidine deaminase|nr:cytidine deaminase [Clostridiales Family XIII bacterium]